MQKNAEHTSSRSSTCPDAQNEVHSALKPPVTRRRALPHDQIYGGPISVVSILTRNLPICVFEPLGDVQVAAEELRYAYQYLNKMCSIEDPSERLCLLGAFAVSGYSAMVSRRRKPFNPLLGETYDYISEDGWKYHGEKVSHHPSITACHVEGPDWEFFQTLQGKFSFTLSSVSITSILPARLRLANGDEYSWNKVTTTIQKVRSEAHNRRVLNKGDMVIKANTGFESHLRFSGCDRTISGEVFRVEDGVIFHRLTGSWDKGLNRITANNQHSKLFEPIPLGQHADLYYGFSDFAVTLNEVHEHEFPYLPTTDSRFRPDQRHLENAESHLAEQVKKHLEQSQRERAHLPHRPMWFHKQLDPFTGETYWRSNNLYWRAKEAQFQDEHSQRMLQLFEKRK